MGGKVELAIKAIGQIIDTVSYLELTYFFLKRKEREVDVHSANLKIVQLYATAVFMSWSTNRHTLLFAHAFICSVFIIRST